MIFACGAKRLEFAGHAVVKPGADCNQQVAVLHGEIGIGRAVHTEHIQRAGVVLVISPQAHQRHGHRDIGFVGQCPQFFGWRRP